MSKVEEETEYSGNIAERAVDLDPLARQKVLGINKAAIYRPRDQSVYWLNGRTIV
jgi:hypothetical protein